MGLIQPKPFINKMKLRHNSYGVERRRNMSKVILEHGTPLPKPVSYEDIDQEFFEWVDKKIDIVYDGKKLPTFKLFSTQRISEYSQTWKNVDESGSLVLNFKTITRAPNPQKGENQGSYMNIPGHRNYAVFYEPVLQENGTEAYDMYTMKQPFSVNFEYMVGIVCSKYELLNRMNELMNYEFQSIQTYIFPNGHPMPITLEDISDESEYTIDDRKYYSQIFKLKLKAYIIRSEDFSVTHLPSRMIIRSFDDTSVSNSGFGMIDTFDENISKIRNSMIPDSEMDNKEEDKNESSNGYSHAMKDDNNRLIDQARIITYDSTDSNGNTCEPDVPVNKFKDKNTCVKTCKEEEESCCCNKEEEERYYNKKISVVIDIDSCNSKEDFIIDVDMILDTVETENVYDMVLKTNEETMSLDGMDINFYKGDKITIEITRDDLYEDSKVILHGYDPNSVIDSKFDAESPLDEISDEEIILVKK